MTEPSLKRSLSLPLLVIYGVGTMVGGGFYALLGEVAREAGMLAPCSFLVASLLALFSAFSFAELSARYPVSAGEARYVQEAFGKRAFAVFVGGLVILTGIVSAATLANAIGGFLFDLTGTPIPLTIVVCVFALGGVAAWGITQSIVLAAVITFLELAGLVLVVVFRGEHLAELPARWRELVPSFSGAAWGATLTGSYLAFYAFIGFEDMVNVAEEVKEPRRNLPRGILMTLVATGLLYLVVCTVAVLAVDPEELGVGHTPLAQLFPADSRFSRPAIGVISVLTGVNGALVQIIMAARVAYGLADGSRAAWFAKVHPRTRTPVRATVLATALVLVLALGFPLVTLAQATSTIILCVFALVNLSLWIVKRRGTPAPEGAPSYPAWLPLTGFLASSAFAAYHVASAL